MSVWLAVLRGINVGGSRPLPMAQLGRRKVFYLHTPSASGISKVAQWPNGSSACRRWPAIGGRFTPVLEMASVLA
ncbi:MAG TPA: hypothetical protein VHK24_07350 [Steroidobacter sp.]|jgi:hypothetical protein|nr:hypothetical protein [Steroidobacter sp.]